MKLDRIGNYWPETLSIVRIVVALLFLEHGSAKLLGFPTSPNPAPAIMTLAWFQGVIELVGGFLLALGLFTRPVALILGGDMAVAYFMAARVGGASTIISLADPRWYDRRFGPREALPVGGSICRPRKVNWIDSVQLAVDNFS
jgi:uncharacterized membrane protein YphA (DoxX/SURF4 family)